MDSQKDRAVAEVLGAIAYALLRVFQVAAHVTRTAPTLALRERQAEFAVEEYRRYRVIRRRLDAVVPVPGEAIARFRGPLDAFYDSAPSDAWLDAQVFHFIGDAITTDFAELLAVNLDDDSAGSVREALTGRSAHEAFALDQIRQAMVARPAETAERAGSVTARVVGEALNRLREAVLDSDALATVLGGEGAVKDLVLEILARHRERLERLGLDRVD